MPLSNWREGSDSAKTTVQRAEPSPFAAMAAKRGWSEAQLLLRWGLEMGFAVLPKSTHGERVLQNIQLFGQQQEDYFSVALDQEEMAAISAMDRNEAFAFGNAEGRFDPVEMP